VVKDEYQQFADPKFPNMKAIPLSVTLTWTPPPYKGKVYYELSIREYYPSGEEYKKEESCLTNKAEHGIINTTNHIDSNDIKKEGSADPTKWKKLWKKIVVKWKVRTVIKQNGSKVVGPWTKDKSICAYYAYQD